MNQPKENLQDPKEESIFEDVEVDLRGYQKHIRRARILLFIIAGLQLVVLFFMDKSNTPEDNIIIGVYVLVAMLFAALAFWTKYKPYAALVTALVLYLSLLAATIIMYPHNIASGLFLKILVIVLLARGIGNAKEAEEIKKTFNR